MKRVVGIKEIQKLETDILRTVVRLCKEHNITYYLSYGSLLGAIRHGGPIPWDMDVDISVPYPQLQKFLAVMRENLPDRYVICEYGTTTGYNILFPRIGIKRISSQNIHADVFFWVGLPSDPRKQRMFIKKFKILTILFRYKNKSIALMSPSIIKRCCAFVVKVLLMPISNSTILSVFHKQCSKYPFENAEYVTNPCAMIENKNILNKAVLGNPTVASYDDIIVSIPEKYVEYLHHYYGDYMQYPSQEERERGLTFMIEIEESSSIN
jgi:lipopolysaccharide cholinephosphotransferase